MWASDSRSRKWARDLYHFKTLNEKCKFFWEKIDCFLSFFFFLAPALGSPLGGLDESGKVRETKKLPGKRSLQAVNKYGYQNSYLAQNPCITKKMFLE